MIVLVLALVFVVVRALVLVLALVLVIEARKHSLKLSVISSGCWSIIACTAPFLALAPLLDH